MIFRYLAGGLAVATMIAVGGWWIAKDRLGDARTEADTYKAAYASLQNTLKVERAQAESARQIEQQYQEALTNANTEIRKLRDAASAGSIRVLVNADCSVPKAATAKPGNDAGSAKLTSDAESAYFDLVEQHQRILAQVKALQDFAILCSSGTQPQP